MTKNKKKVVKVFIDPGHGGLDSGAYNYAVKVKESWVALKVAKELKKLMKNEKSNIKYKFKFSRHVDKYVDLNSRWKSANAWKANVSLCIHCNSSVDKDVRGTEVFYYGKNDKDLAREISLSIAKELKVPNRGAKEYAWAMTKYPTMPAVLIEIDFVSNNTFAKKCKTEKGYIKTIAKAIYNGYKKA